MGLSPRVVDAMSLWEFSAACFGWQRAQGAEEEPPIISDERYRQIVAESEGR